MHSPGEIESDVMLSALLTTMTELELDCYLSLRHYIFGLNSFSTWLSAMSTKQSVGTKQKLTTMKVHVLIVNVQKTNAVAGEHDNKKPVHLLIYDDNTHNVRISVARRFCLPAVPVNR